MLNEKNIDTLMQTIQAGSKAYVYYIAHNCELREGYVDELAHKSNASFRVLKLEVKNITNALWEVLKFLSSPSNYTTEVEEVYIDAFTMYKHYYTLLKEGSSFSKPFNPRLPSIIFGVKREVYKNGIKVSEYNDPSPIKEVYTNALSYSDYSNTQIQQALNSNKLAWKYKALSPAVLIDSISFSYLTSDWFIMDVDGLPRTEKPLINIKQKTAYFMSKEEALSYVKELIL